tara:strand:- start:2979 stop:3185 length:207 start_codon:yes stop_codon:yes gene_type:complete
MDKFINVEELAGKKLESRPNNRVRIVAMASRENEALLYRLGDGKLTKGLDTVFEMLSIYQEQEKRRRK